MFKGVLNSNWVEQLMHKQETIKGDRFLFKMNRYL